MRNLYGIHLFQIRCRCPRDDGLSISPSTCGYERRVKKINKKSKTYRTGHNLDHIDHHEHFPQIEKSLCGPMDPCQIRSRSEDAVVVVGVVVVVVVGDLESKRDQDKEVSVGCETLKLDVLLRFGVVEDTGRNTSGGRCNYSRKK